MRHILAHIGIIFGVVIVVLIPIHIHAAMIGESCIVDSETNTDDCTAGICDDTIGVCICVEDTDCNIGETCLQGQCMALADNCTEDADCTSGERCDIVGGGICVSREDISSTDEDSGPDVGDLHAKLKTLDKISGNSGSARTSVPQLIGRGLALFTGIFGSVALGMIIYGGIQIMLAGGQGDKVKQGTKIIAWASIGLMTMLLSYVLVNFLLGAF